MKLKNIKSVDKLSESHATFSRYSDAELTEFRILLENKLEAAKSEFAYLQGLLTHKDATGGGDSDNKYMTMEDGGLSRAFVLLMKIVPDKVS